MLKRWREIGGRLVLLGCSLLLGLLLMEVAVRLVLPQPLVEISPGLYEPDPPRRFRLTPSFVGELSNGTEFRTAIVIDDRGLRTAAGAEDRSSPKVADVETEDARVLVVGDSFVFGWGVEAEEAFPALLDHSLQGAEVLNGGVPGFGLPDMEAWLRANVASLAPDLVLVAIFLGNDLLDATEKHRAIEMSGGLVAEAGASRGPRRWLNQNLHLLRALKSALPIPLQSRLRSLFGLPEPWAVSHLRDYAEGFAVQTTPLAKEGREASRAALGRIQALAQEQGFALALTLMPGPLQALPERWQATMAGLQLDPSAFDPEVPGRFFAELASEMQLPLSDLQPAFVEGSTGSELYFRADPHWTAEGHQLAADQLQSFLVDRLHQHASDSVGQATSGEETSSSPALASAGVEER